MRLGTGSKEGLVPFRLRVRDRARLRCFLKIPESYPGFKPLVIPQGRGRARAYLFYGTDLERLQGERDITRFVDECIKAGMPAEMYAGARAVGPLASFDMTETWVDHPYRDGVVLVGDAAGASDPLWEKGLRSRWPSGVWRNAESSCTREEASIG